MAVRPTTIVVAVESCQGILDVAEEEQEEAQQVCTGSQEARQNPFRPTRWRINELCDHKESDFGVIDCQGHSEIWRYTRFGDFEPSFNGRGVEFESRR